MYIICDMISDFSLTNWLGENQLADTSALSSQDHKLSQLLDELSVSQYLLATPCVSSSPSAVDGWTQSLGMKFRENMALKIGQGKKSCGFANPLNFGQ